MAILSWNNHRDVGGQFIAATYRNHGFIVQPSSSGRHELTVIYPSGCGAISYHDEVREAKTAALKVVERMSNG